MPKPILLAEILLFWEGVFLKLQMWTPFRLQKRVVKRKRKGWEVEKTEAIWQTWAVLVYPLEHQPRELLLRTWRFHTWKNQGDVASDAPFLSSHKVRGNRTSKQINETLFNFVSSRIPKYIWVKLFLSKHLTLESFHCSTELPALGSGIPTRTAFSSLDLALETQPIPSVLFYADLLTGTCESINYPASWEIQNWICKGLRNLGAQPRYSSGIQLDDHVFNTVLNVRIREIIEGVRTQASLVARSVKNLPAMQETWVRFLGREDPLEKEMATHFIFLPGESHEQRHLAGYSPGGHKSKIQLSD